MILLIWRKEHQDSLFRRRWFQAALRLNSIATSRYPVNTIHCSIDLYEWNKINGVDARRPSIGSNFL